MKPLEYKFKRTLMTDTEWVLAGLAISASLKPSLLTNCRDFRLIPENLRSLACGSLGYKGDMFAC